MKFRCERDALSEAISSAGRAVASRSGALPILSGLLVRTGSDEIHLAGSDLELTIRVSAPAECDSDGAAVLPARLFGDIVRSLEPGAVSVDVGEDEARIESGRSKFSLRVLAAEDFPRLPDVAGSGVRMDATALAEALRQVIPAASRDDARPILTGVLLVAEGSGLRLVATDSYRLGVRDLPGESVLAAHLSGAAAEGRHVLVPAKALGELQRLLGSGAAPGSSSAPGTENTVELSFSDRDACFDTGRARVSTRLIEGQFPNYQQLIPTGYPNRLVVTREGLIEAVKRVRLIGRDRDNAPIRLTMSSSGLELTTIVHDVGEAKEELDAKYEGTETTIAFNPEFLLDGLGAISSEEVSLETLDTSKPAIVRSADGGDFLYLLMPVRVS
ncbi:MAG TPA: DNA polymerase III subunit beta [Acidimicrobiia bacterium]|nr:DNA polymerase III subunit beta [Acidimicrobiia bacterium]